MTGIWMVGFAGLCALIALVLYFLPPLASAKMPPLVQKLFGWGFWLILCALLLVVALEWGNVGVIYSHAGVTG